MNNTMLPDKVYRFFTNDVAKIPDDESLAKELIIECMRYCKDNFEDMNDDRLMMYGIKLWNKISGSPLSESNVQDIVTESLELITSTEKKPTKRAKRKKEDGPMIKLMEG